MKCSFLHTLFLLLTLYDVSYATDSTTVEDKIVQAWQRYVKSSSSANAHTVYDLLSSVDHHKFNIQTQLFEENLSILERRVITSNRNSVRLAFLLFTVSDGDFSEELDIMLGKLIRLNPNLFLQELKAHREIVARIDALVGNFGPEFVDKEEDQKKEAELRIAALKSVRKKELADVKDECVRALEKR